MAHIRTFVLILGAISFIIVIGGAVYEHTALVPVWTNAIPASLSMFQGEYGIRPINFWSWVHPVTMLFLLLSLVLNWRTARRPHIILVIGGYFLTLLVTFIYFVPELLALTQSAYSTAIDPVLTARGGRWESLSLVRLAFMILLAIVLLLGVARDSAVQDRTKQQPKL